MLFIRCLTGSVQRLVRLERDLDKTLCRSPSPPTGRSARTPRTFKNHSEVVFRIREKLIAIFIGIMPFHTIEPSEESLLPFFDFLSDQVVTAVSILVKTPIAQHPQGVEGAGPQPG